MLGTLQEKKIAKLIRFEKLSGEKNRHVNIVRTFVN